MTRRPLGGGVGVVLTGAMVAAASLAAIGYTESLAQEGTVTSAGVFTEEQAARGEDTYMQECAACHLDDLLGDGIAPPLLGIPFSFRWSELSIGDMYAAIRTTMPQGAPASLSAQGYVDIIAYLLHANEYPTGDTELPTEEAELQRIIVDDGQGEGGAQEDSVTSAGVFTEEQAARGEDTYMQECAACHLDDLLGDGIAPPLLGIPFSFRWSELSIGDMYAAIRTTMPQGAPASLSAQGYVDIIAYLLHANEYPTGESELPTEEAALQQIVVDDKP